MGSLIWRSCVKKKATKAARKHPTDFPELKLTFFKRIHEEVTIALELLLSWDQTGVKLVPVSSWTMEQTTCMLEYLENIVPYVTSTRQALDLPENQPAIALFDVFAVYCSHCVLNLTTDFHSCLLYWRVTAPGCWHQRPIHSSLEAEILMMFEGGRYQWYQGWYEGASLMKPLNANWLTCAISTLSDKPGAIKKLSESLTI